MRKGIPKILVTGGAGFIGSAFVRLLLKKGLRQKGLFPQKANPKDTKGTVPEMLRDCSRQSYSEVFKRELSFKDRVIVVDKLTYAGDLARLKEVEGRYKFYKADICNKKQIESIFKRERPGIVVHSAAETHVDRSILDSMPFIRTNVIGTQILLDISRKYKIQKFIHISTDECYGDIKKGKFTEKSHLKPNSPYAASKSAADLLIRSYIRTYGFPAIIVRPCNNYGPWQYPEKLIPLAILKLLKNEKIPIYANGKNRREWLYVEDCVEGILQILEKGRIGEIYNLGSGGEMENIAVAKMLLKMLNKESGKVEFVKDRPGHDIRYSLDSSRIFTDIKWNPKLSFSEGLKRTVQWCLENRGWLLGKWRSILPLYRLR